MQTVDVEAKSDPVARSEGGPKAAVVAEEKSGVEHGTHSTKKVDAAPNPEPVSEADEKLEVSDDADHPADSRPDPVGAPEPSGHAEGKSGEDLDERPLAEAKTMLYPLRATEPIADSEGKSGGEQDMHPTAHPDPVSDAEDKSDMGDDTHPSSEADAVLQSLSGAEPEADADIDIDQKSVRVHASDPASRLSRKRAASAPPDRRRRGRPGKTSAAILDALDHKEADLEMEPLRDVPRHRINRMALRALYLIGENITKK